MINLNNDVLNRDRRKLFPKINTIDNKFSLNTINFLKQQNPFKFYRTFYFKHIKRTERKQIRLKKNKSVNCLSLLSKVQNHFYSLPIQYDSNCENNITKSNKNLELNKLESEPETKNETENGKDLLYYNKEINYIDFQKNKALKNLHKYLIGEKKMNYKEVKNKTNTLLIKSKKSKSSFNIYMEAIENNLEKNKFNDRIRNIFRNNNLSNLKISQKQQTIKSEYGCHNKLIIEGYKCSKPKFEKKNEENKFSIEFIKEKNKFLTNRSRNKNIPNNFLTSIVDTYKVNVFWSNLRRPIIINSSNSLSIK